MSIEDFPKIMDVIFERGGCTYNELQSELNISRRKITHVIRLASLEEIVKIWRNIGDICKQINRNTCVVYSDRDGLLKFIANNLNEVDSGLARKLSWNGFSGEEIDKIRRMIEKEND